MKRNLFPGVTVCVLRKRIIKIGLIWTENENNLEYNDRVEIANWSELIKQSSIFSSFFLIMQIAFFVCRAFFLVYVYKVWLGKTKGRQNRSAHLHQVVPSWSRTSSSVWNVLSHSTFLPSFDSLLPSNYSLDQPLIECG
jgi:hypothetical protein